MSDDNRITVRGWVGTDPEISITPNQRSVAEFRLGSTRRFRDPSGEWRDADTEWFTVKAWGALSDAVVTSIHRGMPVIVGGTFRTEEWQSNEQPRHKKVITASAVAVDIRYGLVRYVKIVRDALAGNGTPAASPDLAEAGPATDEDLTAADADGPDAQLADTEDTRSIEPDSWATPVPSSS